MRTGGSAITSVNLAEVIDQFVRPARIPTQEVEASLASLVAGGLLVVAVDEPMGRLAGRLRADHYDRTSAPLSMADCVALAASKLTGAGLATSDKPLADVARREGVTVVALPNSARLRP